MAESLNLPQNVKPVWIEGLFTSEYERDTLPLLFAADKVFDDYYAALKAKNPNLSIAIDQIRERNSLARLERQDGMWMECVDSLAYCVNLRKAVFDESDFQHIAAQKHHIMSLLNFATFFLRESSGKTKEPMLMRSFELFKKAEEAVAHVRGREDRSFLKTAIENNYSVYFAKRKKYCAAAQRMMLAVRAWVPLQIKEHQFYFAVQKSSGDLWSGRVDDAVIGLKQASAMYSKKKMEKAASPQRQRTDQEFSDDSDASSSDDDDDAAGHGQQTVTAGASNGSSAPFRYKIHVLNCGLDADLASCIAVHHNLAIALIAQRRYKEAVGWVTKALEVVSAQSTLLTATHPIVVAIRNAEEFCNKMSTGSKMALYKMKRDEHTSQQHRDMQAAVLKTREAEPKPPGGHRGHSANAQPRFRKPSHVEAIQTYIKNISTRRLVEEYGFEDPRKSRSKSPPKRDVSSSPPRTGQSRPTSSPQKEASRVRQDNPAASASSVEASPARASTRSNSPASSRSRSPVSSRASSRSASGSPARPSSGRAVDASQPVHTPETQPSDNDGAGNAPVVHSPPDEDTPQGAEVHDAAAAETDASPAAEATEAEASPETAATETEAAPETVAENSPHVSTEAIVQPEASPPEESNEPASENTSDVTPAEPPAPEGADGTRTPAPADEVPSVDAVATPPDAQPESEPQDEPLPAATPTPPPPAPEPVVTSNATDANDQRVDTTYGDDGFESASEAGSPLKAKAPLDDAADSAAAEAEPRPVAVVQLDNTRASTTYDDDGFEASEAGSPEKSKPDVAPAPTDATNAQDYTMDFNATADSNFSPPPPKRPDFNDSDGAAAEPEAPAATEPNNGANDTLNTSAVEHAPAGADTTYGDGDFDTDTSA